MYLSLSDLENNYSYISFEKDFVWLNEVSYKLHDFERLSWRFLCQWIYNQELSVCQHSISSG